MSRFVKPETTILRLAGGDTITVRKRLNAGEKRDRLARWTEQVDDPEGGVKLRPILIKAGLATITAYLLDWTLTDETGRLVDVRGASIADLETILDNLEGDTLNEIREAIEAHETAMEAERAEQKKNGWTERVVADLAIARRCGWRYEWVEELDADVYAILVDELVREQAAAEK